MTMTKCFVFERGGKRVVFSTLWGLSVQMCWPGLSQHCSPFPLQQGYTLEGVSLTDDILAFSVEHVEEVG